LTSSEFLITGGGGGEGGGEDFTNFENKKPI
jgi:hypothetical protein